MIEQIMTLALGNGLWATLFCLLFLYQLKDSRAREKRYSQTIEELSKSLGKVENIKQDCEEILHTLGEVKEDCKVIKEDSKVIKSDIKGMKKGAGNEL